MNLYETIKAAVTTRQAAESFGIGVSKHGMAKCPFHDDHHPSLKLDKRYYCFACGESGDVIDFTAKIFGISVHSAVIKLARDFGINPRPPTQMNIPVPNAEPLYDEQPCIFCYPGICNDTVAGSRNLHRRILTSLTMTGSWRPART